MTNTIKITATEIKVGILRQERKPNIQTIKKLNKNKHNMKKTIKTIAALLIIGMSFTACTKEESPTPAPPIDIRNQHKQIRKKQSKQSQHYNQMSFTACTKEESPTPDIRGRDI